MEVRRGYDMEALVMGLMPSYTEAPQKGGACKPGEGLSPEPDRTGGLIWDRSLQSRET